MFQRICCALLITFKMEKGVLTHNFIGTSLSKLPPPALNSYFRSAASHLQRPENPISLGADVQLEALEVLDLG